MATITDVLRHLLRHSEGLSATNRAELEEAIDEHKDALVSAGLHAPDPEPEPDPEAEQAAADKQAAADAAAAKDARIAELEAQLAVQAPPAAPE